jgi:group I intron endonuclease
MINSGIYLIYFTTSIRFYIGKTNNFSRRRNAHLSQLRRNEHSNKIMQNLFNLHGEGNFIFQPYIFIDRNSESFIEDYTAQEQILLDKYINYGECMNCDPISGFGGVATLSPEDKEVWRKNMAEGIKNKWTDPEYRKNNLEGRHGRFSADVISPDGELLCNYERKDLAKHYGKDSTCWSDLIRGRKKSCFKYRLPPS